jgi:two-component system sensor histidine kinase BaeS
VLVFLSLTAIASCVLTVGVAVVLLRHRIASQRMTALESQADVLAAVGGAPGALSPGSHVYAVGSGRPRRLGPVASAAILDALPSSGATQGTTTVDGRALLYAARLTTAGEVVLVRSAALRFAEWRPMLGSLLIAGLGGVLLAIALSYLLARRLTRPIGQLAGATRRLAAGESDVAVPIEGDDELSQLGTAFNEMSAELVRARDAQRQFLESVSHELKTPLTSIRGYAEGLEEHAIDRTEGARVIATEAGRLERLVADLLDLARFGRADFAVAREPVDLGAVAVEAVERHLPRARELSVELSSDIAGEAGALADHERLLQATSNLVENALRLTPAGGSVTVRVRPGQVSVRDSGPGLAPEDIPHAFERFYLHDRYRSERPVGSGLGLAIVEQLVTAMGGTVEASASPGGGAEFTIRLAPTPARSVLRDAARPSA